MYFVLSAPDIKELTYILVYFKPLWYSYRRYTQKESMIEIIQDHKVLFFWLTVSSGILLFLSLIIVPLILILLPADYFVNRKEKGRFASLKLTPPRLIFLIVKNLCGAVLLICGIAMLVLPGQGLLTILLSVMLLDFPKKYKMERWLVSRPSILRSINYLRKRARRDPFKVD